MEIYVNLRNSQGTSAKESGYGSPLTEESSRRNGASAVIIPKK